jgi:hypothetical protein
MKEIFNFLVSYGLIPFSIITVITVTHLIKMKVLKDLLCFKLDAKFYGVITLSVSLFLSFLITLPFVIKGFTFQKYIINVLVAWGFSGFSTNIIDAILNIIGVKK